MHAFGAMKFLRDGPAPLTLASLGCSPPDSRPTRAVTAWTPLTDAESAHGWDRVERELQFHPSVDPRHWPGFVPPTPHRTYAIGHVYGPSPERAAALEADLERAAAQAFRAVTRAGERVLALDWQHASYWLDPHALIVGAEWTVPALPNGDYYLFLAPDLRWGWLGHPWEQTITLYGEPLLAAIDRAPPTLFSQVIREALGAA